jgi:cytochrome c-type biogenesis protein CcmH
MDFTQTIFLRWARHIAIVVALMSVMLVAVGTSNGPVWAQASAPPVVVPENITADQVNDVARELWCPLCSGVRLDACELKACDQMKEVIAIKLGEGEDVESIKTYFIEQYGPQVLGEPPRSGFNLLAWILPVVGVVVGGFFFWRMTSRMVVRPPDHPSGTTANRPSTSDDDYDRKLEEELARYG